MEHAIFIDQFPISPISMAIYRGFPDFSRLAMLPQGSFSKQSNCSIWWWAGAGFLGSGEI